MLLSSSWGGGGGGGGRKFSGWAVKVQLPGPLALGGKAGLPQVSEDRLTGGGGGSRLLLGRWFSLLAPGEWLAKPCFSSLVVSVCVRVSRRGGPGEGAAWGIGPLGWLVPVLSPEGAAAG